MPTFHITGLTSTDVTITAELTDDEVKDKHPDDIVDSLLDEFHEKAPSQICAQCSGWGQNWSRSVGDEYEYIITDDRYETLYENETLKGAFLDHDGEDNDAGSS